MAFDSTYRKPVAPTREMGKDHLSDWRDTHPAYGKIAVSRVSGYAELLDSDFPHQHYMVIRIHRTEHVRSLSGDRYHESRLPIVEVALSESQWATFVSSPNVGAGSPCTIQFTEKDGPIPQILKEPKTDQFAGDIKKDLQDMLDAITEMERVWEDQQTKVSASVRAIMKEQLRVLRARASDGMPFVAKRFDEHMEKTVDKAKSEVHAYIQNTLAGAGLEALEQLKDATEQARQKRLASKPTTITIPKKE